MYRPLEREVVLKIRKRPPVRQTMEVCASAGNVSVPASIPYD
jgi:hypothetical protein